MRTTISIGIVLTLAACASTTTTHAPAKTAAPPVTINLAPESNKDPLQGGWVSKGACLHLFVFHDNGRANIVLGSQIAEATYEVSDQSLPARTYQLVTKVTEVSGSTGCAGETLAMGQTATRFVKFKDPKMDHFDFCTSATGDDCIGDYSKAASMEFKPL